jgi:hypothetical protein
MRQAGRITYKHDVANEYPVTNLIAVERYRDRRIKHHEYE